MSSINANAQSGEILSLPNRLIFEANSAILAETRTFAEELGGDFSIDASPSDIYLRIADTTSIPLGILRAIEVARGGGDVVMTCDTTTAVAMTLKFCDRITFKSDSPRLDR